MRCKFLLWLLPALAACAVPQERPHTDGQLAIALRKGAESGLQYRLRDATLLIAGARAASYAAPDDEDVFRTQLPPGDYTLRLRDGWRLEQAGTDGVFHPVDATLASENPQPFSIATGALTALALRFTLADRSAVELSPGTLAVELAVQDAAPPAADDAAPPEAQDLASPAAQAAEDAASLEAQDAAAPAAQATEDAALPDAQATEDAAPPAVQDAAGAVADACGPGLVINEVDYDQDGSDQREFVELYNAGSCAVSTDALALVLRNGGADGAPAYAKLPLAAAGPSIEPGAYLLVGAPDTVAELASSGLVLAVSGFTLQNGPDAIELQNGGVVIDALAYAGVVPGAGEGEPTPAERGQGALARCPNGEDTGDNSADFVVLPALSPLAANAC